MQQDYLAIGLINKVPYRKCRLWWHVVTMTSSEEFKNALSSSTQIVERALKEQNKEKVKEIKTQLKEEQKIQQREFEDTLREQVRSETRDMIESLEQRLQEAEQQVITTNQFKQQIEQQLQESEGQVEECKAMVAQLEEEKLKLKESKCEFGDANLSFYLPHANLSSGSIKISEFMFFAF